MASDAPTAQVSDLDWLMSGLVQRVPHTRAPSCCPATDW